MVNNKMIHFVHLVLFLAASLPSKATPPGVEYSSFVLGLLRSCTKFKYSRKSVHPVIHAAPIAIIGLLCANEKHKMLLLTNRSLLAQRLLAMNEWKGFKQTYRFDKQLEVHGSK